MVEQFNMHTFETNQGFRLGNQHLSDVKDINNMDNILGPTAYEQEKISDREALIRWEISKGFRTYLKGALISKATMPKTGTNLRAFIQLYRRLKHFISIRNKRVCMHNDA